MLQLGAPSLSQVLPGRNTMQTDSSQELFETAYERLAAELPESLARLLVRLRAPDMKWVRMTTGVVFLAGGSMAFLPVLGLELLPLGLLMLAQDIAILREPTAKLLLWLLERWSAFKQRWQRLWAFSRDAGIGSVAT